MVAHTKNRPVHVAPQGWTSRRGSRVLAVEGLSVGETVGRIIAQEKGHDPSVIRQKIVDAIRK